MTDNHGITIVHDEGGDWVGIYKDGQLIEEGHSLSPEMVLDSVGLTYCSRHDWDGAAYGKLDENLEHVVFGMEEE